MGRLDHLVASSIRAPHPTASIAMPLRLPRPLGRVDKLGRCRHIAGLRPRPHPQTGDGGSLVCVDAPAAPSLGLVRAPPPPPPPPRGVRMVQDAPGRASKVDEVIFGGLDGAGAGRFDPEERSCAPPPKRATARAPQDAEGTSRRATWADMSLSGCNGT